MPKVAAPLNEVKSGDPVLIEKVVPSLHREKVATPLR